MADIVSYASRLAEDPSLATMLADHRREGLANCPRFWNKADRLKRFAAREQWPEDPNSRSDRKELNPTRKAPRLTIPETSRVLAAFSGRQILQRFERDYIPRNQTVARFAETLSKVDRAVMQSIDAEQTDSRAFRDGPGIQGVSWVRWYVDEWSGPKPRLRYIDVPIWSMMWPATRELNLRDRAWQRWGSWWPQSTVKERWPEHYDAIRYMIGQRQWSAGTTTPGQSSRIPWAGQAGNKPLNLGDYYDPGQRCFWIEYEEWRELITIWQVTRPVDPTVPYSKALAIGIGEDGTDQLETVEMTSKAQVTEFKQQHFAATNEEVPTSDMIVPRRRMVYRQAHLFGDRVLEHGDLLGWNGENMGTFTFNSMAAEAVELMSSTRYIGLLEDLEDAQRMVNYMMSALIRDIQINPKGVLVTEQGLFRDKNEALAAWTAPGGTIEVPRGRLTQGGAKPYDVIAGGTTAYSSKLEGMLAFYREAIPRLAGFNPAALGQLGTDIRRVSGEVVRQLSDAVTTSNAERFDSLRLYRRDNGRIFLAFARLLWEPEDLIDFIGEEDAYDEVTDPTTGQAQLDPMTGQPVKQLAIPPKAMWNPDSWKEIAIEEVAPTDDELSALWDSLQTQVQLLLQPMADTGQPLFGSEDLIDILPKLPAARRQKMRLRVRQLIQQMKIKQAQEAEAARLAAGQDQVPPGHNQIQGAGQPAGQPVQ